MDNFDELIVQAIRNGLGSSRAILEHLAGIGNKTSQPTLSRRLNVLVEEHHVRVMGKGRATRYEIDSFNEYFGQLASRRKPVSYDQSVVDNYIPNATKWFSVETTEDMLRAGGGRKLDASTYSRAIAQKLLVDLSYASSNLEGNTYSYIDTEVLIEYGQAAEGKAADETQMILNHKEAIVYMIDNLNEIGVDLREIRTLQALLSRGLIEPHEVGAVRGRIVTIGNSAYQPMAIPQRLEDEMLKIVTKAALIDDPFEQSLFLMTMVSYLQYFVDVNKRTGRLAANIPLLKAGLAPLSFMSVDKTKYTKGLLAFYELGRHDLIADAFAEGYISSANRYDAYFGRNRAEIEIEYRHRSELYPAVKAYVTKSLSEGYRLDLDAFLEEAFTGHEADVTSALSRRGADIINNLSSGNNVAYGISRDDFDKFETLPTPPAPPN